MAVAALGLAREPDHAEAVNMHGILLHKDGRFDEAVEVFKQAEAPGHRAAASNRGNSLLDLGRMNEALQAQELGCRARSRVRGARYNLALTRLRLGHWGQGWPGYETRWALPRGSSQTREFFLSHDGTARLSADAGFFSTPSRG